MLGSFFAGSVLLGCLFFFWRQVTRQLEKRREREREGERETHTHIHVSGSQPDREKEKRVSRSLSASGTERRRTYAGLVGKLVADLFTPRSTAGGL